MTAPNNKPVSPEDLVRFEAYHQKYPSWGALHIVLEDGNIRDKDVQHCFESARKAGDEEGAYLAGVLLTMSKSQRCNLPRRI